MTPVLFCKSHNLDGKRLHDFCDTNEKGEVCATGYIHRRVVIVIRLFKTAIQVFTRAYKQVSLDNSYGLLRKARRLDTIMANHGDKAHGGKSTELPTPNIKCYVCHTEYSPFFHAVENNGKQNQVYECHGCYYFRKSMGRLIEPLNELNDLNRIWDLC